MNANLRTALSKALIVLVPTYTIAFLTEQMVYVVPMLAASGFFASYVEIGEANILRRHNDESDDNDEGGPEDHSTNLESGAEDS